MNGSMELWWLGQAGFRLRDPAAGPTVFVDPFLTTSPARNWDAPLSAEELGRTADLILCSHQHSDHFDGPALAAAARAPGAAFKLVVPRPVAGMAVELGVPAERVVGAQPGESLELNGAIVHPVPARHGVDVADAYDFGEDLSGGLTRYLGYVVDLHGVRAYHAGDCVPYPGQAATVGAFQPHLALLPINGRDFYRETERNVVGNMDHREAARLALDLGVTALVPMHWEMFLHNRGFPNELAAYVADFMPQLTVLTLGRNRRFTFTPNADT
jgi:L-ascorbate metabolism protein UlaG (beta-lactamase superfamily)